MTETLKKFLIALKNQPNLAQQWAETLIQSGKDGEANGLQDRGVQLVEGLKAYNNACYEVAVDMFTSLLEQFELEPEGRAVCLAWRGEAYRLISRLVYKVRGTLRKVNSLEPLPTDCFR
jgi:hypothetical protein